MDATTLIVRLGPKNRMVTKDYQRGVYEWGGESGTYLSGYVEDTANLKASFDT